jgi:adenylate cyclase
LLLTDKLAELVKEPIEELGNFPIRGIADPVTLSAVAERAS